MSRKEEYAGGKDDPKQVIHKQGRINGESNGQNEVTFEQKGDEFMQGST